MSSRLEKFFLVIPPGLEDLAVQELKEKVSQVEVIGTEKGGVTLLAPFEIGLVLNFVLKIPTAIYWRLAEFKCRDLPKLYQKVSNIKWSRCLLGNQFELNVKSSKSRLLNEKKIEKSVREGIARHFEKQPPKKADSEYAFTVHVRFFQDVCTLSLNMTGEPLFKRGYKKMSGPAPMRENLAAALFYALWLELGGFEVLTDPMCGSGSLLLEAAQFWHTQEERSFAFQNRREWRGVAEKIPPQEVALEKGVRKFYAFDKDQKSIQNLEESLKNLERKGAQMGEWLLATHDVFSDQNLTLSAAKRGATRAAVICNPPYGERLRLPLPPKEFYFKWFQQVMKGSPSGIGLVLPAKWTKFMPLNIEPYFCVREWSFENGGLPVVFRVYKTETDYKATAIYKTASDDKGELVHKKKTNHKEEVGQSK